MAISARFRFKAIARLAAIASICALANSALAAAPDPLPAHPAVDGNGVDLVTGAFNYPGPSVTIGQPGAGGLTYALNYVGAHTGASVPYGWRSNWQGTVTKATSTSYFVNLGGQSERFSYSGGAFTSVDGTGATLAYSTSTELYTYTGGDGTVAIFDDDIDNTENGYNHAPTGAILTQITRPNGEVVDLNYDIGCIIYDSEFGGCMGFALRLESIANNFGYLIHLDYASDDDSGNEVAYGWNILASVVAINLAVDYCDPYADDCTSLSQTWPNFSIASTNTPVDSATDTLGRTTTYSYVSGTVKLSGVKWPGSSSDNLVITWDTNNRVQSVNRGFGTWSYAYVDASGDRTTTITQPGSATTVVVSALSTGLISSVTDQLSRSSTYTYDSGNRLTQATAPEGNYTTYTYDARGNTESVTSYAKSSSGLPSVGTSAAFPMTCTNPVTCNKPTSTTDARGFTTDYTYDSTHGGLLTATAPDPDGSGSLVRPQTRITYAQKQARYKDSATTYVNGAAVWVPVSTSACATTLSCASGADETVTEIAFPTTSNPNNLLPLSATSRAGNNAVSATTAFTYDNVGNLLTVDGPLSGTSDTSKFVYDAGRRRIGAIGPDPDGGGSLKFRAVRTTYDNWDLVTRVEQGTVNSQSDSEWANFVTLAKAETVYDAYGRAVQSKVFDPSTVTIVTQTSYDALGRVDCVAQRMNPAIYGSLPSSACTLGTTGGYGADRIVKTTYDAASEVLTTISGYGTSLQQTTATETYTTNGRLATVKDARNALTTYEYDGHDNLVKTRFPDPSTPNTSSTTDYEQQTYNYAAGYGGLLTGSRRRDAQTFAFTYDNLSRLTARDAPGSEPDSTFAYDNFGRMISATRAGQTLTYAYDQLSRLLSEAGPIGAVAYQYDAAGRRTRITWPGSPSLYAQYDYDVAGAVTAIRENGAASGLGVLATYAYDDFGRRSSVTRGNGVTTTLGFDGLSRLTSLVHNPSGTAADQTYGFSYNPSSQITQASGANAAFDFAHGSNYTNIYTVNQLNQYLTAAGATITHDARGNLTSDGAKTYAYDADNRLTSVSGGASASLSYDPAGRLYQIAASA